MFFLKLDQQDVAVIVRALGAQPLDQVIQTWGRIQQQLAEHQQRQQAAQPAANGEHKPADGEADKIVN